MTRADVSGLPLAQAIARVYDQDDPQPQVEPYMAPDDYVPGLALARGVLYGLAIAAAMWAVIVVVLSLTL